MAQAISSPARPRNRHWRWLSVFWLLLSLLLAGPRLLHSAFGLQGDLPLHYYIAQSYARSFAEGDWLPRWAGTLDGGRGDAIFTFYPPLTYFIGAVFITLFKVSVIDSLKLVTLLALFLAQLSAYSLGRQFFPRRLSLLVSSVYVLLPAYLLISLHRAFLANALALSIAPLVLLGAYRLLTRQADRCGFALFVLSASALMLTHLITTYLCGLVIAGLLIFYWPRARWAGALRLVGASCVVALLTAFFLVPQLIEASWVQLQLQVEQQDYRNYFLFAPALDASRYRQAWAGVNEVTGYQTLTLLLTVITLWLMCRPGWRRHALAPLIHFALALTVFGLLLALPIAEPLWRWLPGLKFVQFPWRFQPLVALGCGLLSAAALTLQTQLRRWPRLLLSTCLTWMVVLDLIFTAMLVYLPASRLTRAQVAAQFAGDNQQPSISLEEMRRMDETDDPRRLPYRANQIYFRPRGADLLLHPPAQQPGGAAIITGTGSIRALRQESAHREFQIDGAADTQVRFETYAYPHWVVRLDGREIATRAEPGTGLMLVALPPGTHRLRLDFAVRHRGERSARWVSAATWLLFVSWLVWRRKRKQESQ